MANLKEALNFVSNEMAKKNAALEDEAVSSYIKAQADYLILKGEDLTQYELVTDVGYFEIRDGKYTASKRYGLFKKEDIQKITFDEE